MKDILIIGSGPAGLSASIYGKRASLDVLVAEKDYLGTGQIAESSQVDNYLGLVGKSGYDLGEAFRSDAEKMGIEFYTGEAVKIFPEGNIWKTEFDNGEVIGSKTVIYATGASHRRLGVKGEEQFLGKGVSFCALCDGAFFKGKTVAVVGGGDTAVDDALYLSGIAEKVYLIHRRNEFRARESSVIRVKNTANIETVLSANVVEIFGEKKVNGLLLDNGRKLELDGFFEAVGMIPQTALLKDIAELNENGYVIADETGVTKSPGLFVAGDVRTKNLRQVVTATSDGANAAISAVDYIRDTFR